MADNNKVINLTTGVKDGERVTVSDFFANGRGKRPSSQDDGNVLRLRTKLDYIRALRRVAPGCSRMSADVLEDRCDGPPQRLESERLPDHIDVLYRTARAMCGSRYDAEDLVQETFASVLRRPRWIRHGNERAYLLRALKHTYASRARTAAFRAATVQLFEHDAPSCPEDRASSRELMEAIASAPAPYRDAVIAVDVLGLSYREAARSLHTRETTITSRLHRGRHHVARTLLPETPPAA